MDAEQPTVSEELEALRQRVTELENERTRQRARRGPAMLLALVAAAAIGTAWAADGSCPNGLPFCFAANSPARADEVNHNFAYLREWLVNKAGPLDAGVITTPGVQINGQFITGNTGNGNFHINTLPSANGKLYLNWHTGNGGVIFGNGASGQAAAVSATGDLSITTVNGHRPAVPQGFNCANANCTGTCSAGVIRQAWGFHGNNWNAEVGGGWACGGAVEWMGQCIGNTTCTVTTGCGSSAIWIDCW